MIAVANMSAFLRPDIGAGGALGACAGFVKIVTDATSYAASIGFAFRPVQGAVDARLFLARDTLLILCLPELPAIGGGHRLLVGTGAGLAGGAEVDDLCYDCLPPLPANDRPGRRIRRST